MANPILNRERAARVLVDAVELGDRKAAEKWKITERTIGNYRRRLETDEELSKLFRQKLVSSETGWNYQRQRFLAKGVRKLSELIERASVDQIDQVSRALERLGNLDVASQALGVGASTDSEGREAEEAPGQDDGSDADEAVH